MGPSKRHQRTAAPPRQTRTRTRQNKGSLLSDPALNTQLLNDQLRSLGLYAAPTLGDGNCLFRALSDQYYGSSSQHLKLREEICDWMAAQKERYEPFVEDERGLDVHLRCMRQPGTYGGHLELSAFAHLKHRNVKVIQPGLVYVIEWSTGGDPSPSSPIAPIFHEPAADDSISNERERRRLRREKKRDRVTKAVPLSDDEDDEDMITGAVYVAYHDWEHFSSVRNLNGPHTGLPHVTEKPTPPQSLGLSAKSKGKPPSNAAKHTPIDSTQTPLPPSRSVSPTPPSEASASGSSLSLPPSSTGSDRGPSGLSSHSLRIDRSPKRTLEESSGVSGESRSDMSQGSAKRTRGARRIVNEEDIDIGPDADTPSLSASGSSTESSSSSEESSPAPTLPPSSIPSKPLTRRQRKVLGLPKPRSALGNAAFARAPKGAAGKIVIPGGRFKKGPKGAVVQEEDEDEDGLVGEWKANGSGRVDVRGFRELKI